MLKSKIRIIFVARHFPPAVGGAEKLNFELVRRLENYTCLIPIVNRKNKFSPLFLLKGLIHCLGARKVDLFFLTDAALSILIPPLKLFKKVPVIVKVHGLDVTFDNRLYQLIIPYLLKMADKIVCISEATKLECLKRGIRPNRCVVIPIGIEKPVFPKRGYKGAKSRGQLKPDLRKKKMILSVGALVERKGVYWFIKNVVEPLSRKRKDFIYVVVGGEVYKGKAKEKGYKAKIEDLIKQKSLSDYVVLLGRIDFPALEALYNRAAVFVMPNIPVPGDMEGFGIVNLEAAAHRIPVVAANLEGIKDAIQDKKNGFLIKPKDASGFIRTISNLLDNDKMRLNFGRRAQAFTLSRYSWDKIIQRYLNLFKDVVKEHKKATIV